MVHNYQKYARYLVSVNAQQHLVLSLSLILTFLIGVQQYHLVALICIFMMSSYYEHFFMCFCSMCISSSVKFLFISFVHHLTKSFLILLLSFDSSLYSLDISSYDICNVFSQSVYSSWHDLFTVKVLNVDGAQFIDFFSFHRIILMSNLKILYQKPSPEKFLFSSEIFSFPFLR